MNASQIVEAILFASEAPLKTDEIVRADESLDEDIVERAVAELRAFYDQTERSYELVEVAEGYQVLTRPAFATYLERFDTVPRPSRLSGPALEALAIIAYRQPIGRIEVEYIRGVSSAGVIRSLQDRGLVEVVGRAEGLGRPLLYGTTQRFLEHFGFASLEELPRPEELPVVLRERVPLGLDDDHHDAPDAGQLELDEAAGEAVEDATPAAADEVEEEAEPPSSADEVEEETEPPSSADAVEDETAAPTSADA